MGLTPAEKQRAYRERQKTGKTDPVTVTASRPPSVTGNTPVGCLHKKTRPTREAGHWGDICVDCGQIAQRVPVPLYHQRKPRPLSKAEFLANLADRG